MTDYQLEISSWSGYVSGASHYRGRVKGPYPRPCHGTTTTFHGRTGKTTCSEGHELPRRVEWDVEEAWTQERYQRWADMEFYGAGPAQFATEQGVIDTAVARFTNVAPRRWWEEEHVPGQPGDRLLFYGQVIAEVREEEASEGVIRDASGPGS